MDKTSVLGIFAGGNRTVYGNVLMGPEDPSGTELVSRKSRTGSKDTVLGKNGKRSCEDTDTPLNETAPARSGGFYTALLFGFFHH